MHKKSQYWFTFSTDEDTDTLEGSAKEDSLNRMISHGCDAVVLRWRCCPMLMIKSLVVLELGRMRCDEAGIEIG